MFLTSNVVLCACIPPFSYLTTCNPTAAIVTKDETLETEEKSRKPRNTHSPYQLVLFIAREMSTQVLVPGTRIC